MRITSIASALVLSLGAASMVVAGNPQEFAKVIDPSAQPKAIAGGYKFIEGPVWMGDRLLFSDIPVDTMYQWTPDGKASEFRKPSGQSNGNTTDLQGRLITCQHKTRTVTRTEADGKVTVLAEKYGDKRLNSPNDAVVKSDGTIWFTDPPYGLPKQTEGKELDKNHVFRLDPDGKLTAVAADFLRPNGLCFSPDEKTLYIADSASWAGDGGELRHVRVFDVQADNTLKGGKVFAKIDNGVADGMRCDADGRLWASAGDGVHVFLPSGQLIGKIATPETITNLCFGGEDGKTLFMTGGKGNLYSVPVKVTGATRPAR